MVFVKIILITSLLIVFFQDLKAREVYWITFPIIAICAGILLHKNVPPGLFYRSILINILFIMLLILVIYFYSRLKLKSSIRDTFGLGDGLIFIALSFTYLSTSFIILFVFGLIFSLTLHLVLKNKSKFSTVPLAGYLSLFFAISYSSIWSGILTSVYTL